MVFFLKTTKTIFPIVLASMLIAGPVSLYAEDISKDSMMPKKPREEIMTILNHFPAGSIDSLERADQALEVVRIEKANIKARLYNEKLECNKKFFVYWCYEEAEDRRYIDWQALHTLEVEANRFKRSDDVRQRDLALDRREIENQVDEPLRVENVATHEAREKRVQEREAKRVAAEKGITSTPNERHRGNLMTPAEKADNIREYEAKQEESARREERVKQKRAETQQKRDKKMAEETVGK